MTEIKYKLLFRGIRSRCSTPLRGTRSSSPTPHRATPRTRGIHQGPSNRPLLFLQLSTGVSLEKLAKLYILVLDGIYVLRIKDCYIFYLMNYANIFSFWQYLKKAFIKSKEAYRHKKVLESWWPEGVYTRYCFAFLT